MNCLWILIHYVLLLLNFHLTDSIPIRKGAITAESASQEDSSSALNPRTGKETVAFSIILVLGLISDLLVYMRNASVIIWKKFYMCINPIKFICFFLFNIKFPNTLYCAFKLWEYRLSLQTWDLSRLEQDEYIRLYETLATAVKEEYAAEFTFAVGRWKLSLQFFELWG